MQRGKHSGILEEEIPLQFREAMLGMKCYEFLKKQKLQNNLEKERNEKMLQKHIFLIGFMGCGKSRNGSRLARITGAELMEMDQAIVEQQQMSIADIFAKYGEAYFRDLETELLKTLKDREPMVISCGGGVVLREENVALMKELGTVVLLTAEPDTIYERVKGSTARPILNGNMNVEYIRELMEKRQPRYEAAADVTIATDRKQSEEVCREILDFVRELRRH